MTRNTDIEALLAAVDRVLGVAEHASFASGLCCCGSYMDRHEDPMYCGHSAVDSGNYYGAPALEELYKARAKL